MEKHPVLTGAAIVTGAGIAGMKARQKLAETVQGKNKKSFGFVGNLALDVGISYAALKGLQKVGGAHVDKPLSAFSNVLKKSIKGF